MTMPAHAQPLAGRMPSATERDNANQLRKCIASVAEGDSAVHVQFSRGSEIVLTPALTDLLMQLLRHIGNGDAVTLVPVTQMLTTQQAADFLNVSRPYLIKLLDCEGIEYRKVGTHRRVQFEALRRYRDEDDRKRRLAADELSALTQDLGLE